MVETCGFFDFDEEEKQINKGKGTVGIKGG